MRLWGDHRLGRLQDPGVRGRVDVRYGRAVPCNKGISREGRVFVGARSNGAGEAACRRELLAGHFVTGAAAERLCACTADWAEHTGGSKRCYGIAGRSD